jgi:hypothetical protein
MCYSRSHAFYFRLSSFLYVLETVLLSIALLSDLLPRSLFESIAANFLSDQYPSLSPGSRDLLKVTNFTGTFFH